MHKSHQLSAFDFDGTISYRDSFLPFLRFSFGTPAFCLRVLALTGGALLHFAGRLSRDELKARLVERFLRGKSEAWMQEQAREFFRQRGIALLRPKAIAAVQAEKLTGRTVTICSASPRLLLEPFAEFLGVELVATELVTEDGHLTGKLAGGNCRAANKCTRLQERFGTIAHLRAWGDSEGDKEMLAMADEAFFKPFR